MCIYLLSPPCNLGVQINEVLTVCVLKQVSLTTWRTRESIPSSWALIVRNLASSYSIPILPQASSLTYCNRMKAEDQERYQSETYCCSTSRSLILRLGSQGIPNGSGDDRMWDAALNTKFTFSSCLPHGWIEPPSSEIFPVPQYPTRAYRFLYVRLIYDISCLRSPILALVEQLERYEAHPKLIHLPLFWPVSLLSVSSTRCFYVLLSCFSKIISCQRSDGT